MDSIALDLGIIQIYWYSIFIFLAVLTACIIIYKESMKQEIDEDFLINLSFNSIIIGLVGARIYYVLFNLPYYLSNPIEIFEIWKGGLAIHGGLLAGLIFVLIYCKKNKVDALKMLDIIVVGLIIAQAIGRWGNFFNSEAYGKITSYQSLKDAGIPTFIINGMYILGNYRQPTFFYESVWNVFGFLILIIIRQLKKLRIGQLTGIYLIWYGLARFIIEGLRTDSLMLGPIKVAKLVSIIFVISGIILILHSQLKNNKKNNLYNVKQVNNVE